MDDLLPGFERGTHATSGGAVINYRRGGSGRPLLLLHGYPQTHVMWHRVAPLLAEHYTVVAADLRGYGDSIGPQPLPDGSNYTFREMGRDHVELMAALGYERFYLAGHDRGARTSHRLTLDAPAAIEKLALLDIQPTHYAWKHMTADRLRLAWHWGLMAQQHDLPEVLLSSAPREWLLERLLHFRPGASAPYHPAAYAEYLRCLTPAMIAASCADYRAFASIDLEHDQQDLDAGRRLTCPLLALYGERSYGGFDMQAIWSSYADDLRCQVVPAAGHHFCEERPEIVAEALCRFFG